MYLTPDQVVLACLVSSACRAERAHVANNIGTTPLSLRTWSGVLPVPILRTRLQKEALRQCPRAFVARCCGAVREHAVAQIRNTPLHLRTWSEVPHASCPPRAAGVGLRLDQKPKARKSNRVLLFFAAARARSARQKLAARMRKDVAKFVNRYLFSS